MSPAQDPARVTLLIKGRVQGVFYRESARKEAARLGISGWVRNLEDGDVEAVAEGPAEKLDAFVAWCRRGPPSAQVREVLTSYSAPTNEFDGFRVERSR